MNEHIKCIGNNLQWSCVFACRKKAEFISNNIKSKMDISIAKRRAKNAHNSNGSKKKRKKKTAHINNRLNRFTQTLLVYLITISTHTHTCSTTIISFLSINILASRRRNFFSIRMCNTHFEYGAKKFCFVCVFISLIYNYIDDDDTTSTTLKIR